MLVWSLIQTVSQSLQSTYPRTFCIFVPVERTDSLCRFDYDRECSLFPIEIDKNIAQALFVTASMYGTLFHDGKVYFKEDWAIASNLAACFFFGLFCGYIKDCLSGRSYPIKENILFFFDGILNEICWILHRLTLTDYFIVLGFLTIKCYSLTYFFEAIFANM